MGKYTGQKYRPSNGTDGEGFFENFCYRCLHEKYSHTMNDGDKACKIMSDMLLFYSNEPEYPKELIYDDKDNPTCTAHVPFDWGRDDEGGMNEPPPIEPIDPNQMVLPFELMEMKFEQPKHETAWS